MSEAARLSNSDYQQSLLSSIALFRDVSPDDVQLLLERCDRLDMAQGDILLKPGVKNEYLFIVLSGRLDVRLGSPDAPIIASMDVGSCVGEMSIIEDRDPSAFVVAAEPTHLLVIHQAVLWDLVNASHEFCKNLLIVLSERVRSHNNYIAESFGDLQKFERHASTDALTGLRNRHAMTESFPREVARCVADGEPVSLVMIDIDGFKTFNDRFGHVAGDRALSAVGNILHTQFRTCDHLVRYGGDEFAVLLPGIGEKEAVAIAERVRNAVSGSERIDEDSLIGVAVKVSMGVAELRDQQDFEALLRSADAALYRAKDAGRNVVST